MTSLKKLALALGLAAALSNLTGCSNQLKGSFNGSGDRIMGGVKVEKTDVVASMTAMLLNVRIGSVCTVSILSSEWMLTAAHCVEDATAEDLIVIFHSDLNAASKNEAEAAGLMKLARRVQSFYMHPKYFETMKKIATVDADLRSSRGSGVTPEEIDNINDWGDIALVKITGGLPDTQHPAQLLDSQLFPLAAGQTVLLAGYGNTGGTNPESSGTLRKVPVQISNPKLTPSEVLVDQTQGKGACHGDSGGPAYVMVNGQLKLFGITSRGFNDTTNTCDHFSVYTNATAYRPWIKQISGI